jgi:Na+/H+ antiporter NhaA
MTVGDARATDATDASDPRRPAASEPAGQTRWGARPLTPIREFIATQNSSAIVLLIATSAALVWANSPWSDSYERLWHTDLVLRLGDAELALDLRHWINDGLMAFFFFVAGLEIRREFDMGELRERRRVATPVLAAIGGITAPALIYLAFNAGHPSARGWGIAMGTDTAFALGVLTLVGRRTAPRIRVFLLTLVIVDDIAALTVIALAYTDDVSFWALLVAISLYGVVLLFKRLGVRHGVAYFLVAFCMWVAMIASGVHPTIAGVALGVLASARPPSRDELHQAGAVWRLFREQPTPEYARSVQSSLRYAVSPNERLQHLFHPWTSYVIVPLFALANAGIEVNADVLRQSATSRITLGIVFGLVVGKLVGITTATWLATRPRLGGFPQTVTWPPLVGAAAVSGIGFTVALLIADITFEGEALEDAKLGILGASIIATIISALVFRGIERLPERLATAGEGNLALPILDLVEPVDAERDHVRGPEDATVTLVEYADFECPYCGQAESVVRDLLGEYGADLRYVYRHLPLVDVHEHAAMAAEAAEAADAHGKFWEMHDLLFAHNDALTVEDLAGYAEQLGLDRAAFAKHLRDRKYALRVERDLQSADDSGVVGTPTFFVNGRRHHGGADAASLRGAIERELEAHLPPGRTPTRATDR